MRKKKVILTNFNILNYSGSEIDTVTLANYFIQNNYEVDIFTLDYGLPLSVALDKSVRLILPNNTDMLYKKYDLAWIHHYPLLDYLIFNLKIEFKHIVYVSLSSFEPLETLPFYYKELSVICALSDEAIIALEKQMLEKREIIKFPNYATSNFFKYKIKNVDKLKKICIISNHVPEELIEFKKIAKENDLEVDIYGIGNIIKFVDDNLLNSYDVIISIGKTVYYSLAMGKIVYCYDRFGGYGFIDSKNIDKCFKNNFSGRGFGKKLTGSEIYNDIINNYKKVNKSLLYLREYANNNFNFENNIKNILSLLNKKNEVNCKNIINKYPELIIKSKLYVDTVWSKNNLIKHKEETIINLDNQVKKLNENINNLYTSSSWKFTYPFRLIKNASFKILKK